ncbi:MAG TPA: serine/threonine-protein kinase, partial [Trebonia sp.]|nr:serine/threonine-protein kinase [Trebonia sp.]
MTPQRIGSRYLLHERIGEGGTGTVWRAQDVEAGAWRAIKVLTSAYAPDPAAAARFVRERDALLAFRHPNVVTLHDVIIDGERLALVMDLLAEGDLDRLRRDRGGTLPADLAAELTAQVCDGLAAAHAAGIVHGDLKPSNVLMDAGRARITDFGIARKGRADGADTVTAAGMVTGTLGSMSPEALSGADPAPAGDVYAVGVTLYELLAGRQPGAGEAGTTTPGQMRNVPPRPDGIPEPLWRLILSCLEKNPDARPAAAALAEALRNPWLSVAPLAAPAAFGAGAGAGGLLPEPETVIAPGTKTAVPEPETVVPEPETVVPAWQQSWDEAFGRPWPGMTPARPAAPPRTVTGFPPPGTGRPSGGGSRGSATGLHRWGVAAAVAA